MHDTIVALNDARVTPEITCMFSSLPNVTFLERPGGIAQDIGAYQEAAATFPSDLMVFFGGRSYFRRGGWMDRVVTSYLKRGDTLFGATANRGDGHAQPHIRTTGFWISPRLFNQYPHKITTNEERYPFEHGQNCLTSWIKRIGRIPYLVSWDGEYVWKDWDSVTNGFHRGNQSNVLFGDRVTELYRNP